MSKIRYILAGFPLRSLFKEACLEFIAGWNGYYARLHRFSPPQPWKQRVWNAVIAYLCGVRQSQFTIVFNNDQVPNGVFDIADADEMLATAPCDIGPILMQRPVIQINQGPAPETNGHSAPVEEDGKVIVPI